MIEMAEIETVSSSFSMEEKVLSSRFIGVLLPLLGRSFEAAKEGIVLLYPKATHYCYAFKKGNLEGSSDDGEPSHSAGLPLLAILRGSGLDEVALFVVRYFGGTKLGLPRLTHAYREMGKAVLMKAPRSIVKEGLEVLLEIPYPDFDRAMDRIRRLGIEAGKPSFSSSVALWVKGDDKIIGSFLSLFPSIEAKEEKKALIYLEKKH